MTYLGGTQGRVDAHCGVFSGGLACIQGPVVFSVRRNIVGFPTIIFLSTIAGVKTHSALDGHEISSQERRTWVGDPNCVLEIANSVAHFLNLGVKLFCVCENKTRALSRHENTYRFERVSQLRDGIEGPR